MDLRSLGWSETFKTTTSQANKTARIVAVHRSHLSAITENGEININHSTSFTEPLAVGDWIQIGPLFEDGQGNKVAYADELIPRKSKISRMAAGESTKEQLIAANVDTVFIVTSINDDFNLNRLQRYLLLIKEGQSRPVLILSKVDLEPRFQKTIEKIEKEFGTDILMIPSSVKTREGFEQLKSLIPKGSTAVFVGSSGVGKSSLVNLLLGQDVQTVKEVRQGDDKGKHTTTSRQMFFMPEGGMIIDTPGFRGVSVFGAQKSLSKDFNDIEELIAQCRFTNCSHKSDPGCAIVPALESSKISLKRWGNYQKLTNEISANNKKLNRTKPSSKKQSGKSRKGIKVKFNK